MDATWSRPGNGSEWHAAVDRANRVAGGGGLPGIPRPVLLGLPVIETEVGV